MSNQSLPSEYYTIRRISDEPRIYEAVKWENGRPQPLQVYSIVGPRSHCSCPSYKVPCKHVLMKDDALQRGYLDLDQMGKWVFANGKWYPTEGI